jgi:IclR family KDG regulon transcriptional repressor
VPAHCTSSGRALLMDADRAALAAVLDVRDAELAKLERRMARARELGYAAVAGEFEPGLVGVAAPVRDFRGRITGAVNVSGPEFRFGDRLAPAGAEVSRAAQELSRRLGRSSEGGGHD